MFCVVFCSTQRPLGTKTVSDTTFLMPCGQARPFYRSQMLQSTLCCSNNSYFPIISRNSSKLQQNAQSVHQISGSKSQYNKFSLE